MNTLRGRFRHHAGAYGELRVNLNNHDTYTQIRDTLDWAFWNLKTDRATEIYSRELSVVFRRTKISNWLRANLLRQVGSFAIGDHAYSYLLLESGWNKLSRYLNGLTWKETNALLRGPVISNNVAVGAEVCARADWPSSAFLPRTHLEKGLSTDFEYRDWNHRLWNGLQNINSADKPIYWKGIFPWDYDIVNSAPTTLYQLGAMNGASKLLLEPIQHYIDHREEYLKFVSMTCRVSQKCAKKFFTSLFNGAVLSTSYKQSTLGTLGGNASGVLKLKESVGIRALLTSIKYLNSFLERVFQEDAWQVYFRHERANLDIMRAYLDSLGALYFLEHDGFRCDREVDSEFIVTEIKRQTGLNYAMKVRHHVFESSIVECAPLHQESLFDYRSQHEDILCEDHLR